MVFSFSSLSMQATNRGSNGSQSLEKWPTTWPFLPITNLWKFHTTSPACGNLCSFSQKYMWVKNLNKVDLKPLGLITGKNSATKYLYRGCASIPLTLTFSNISKVTPYPPSQNSKITLSEAGSWLKKSLQGNANTEKFLPDNFSCNFWRCLYCGVKPQREATLTIKSTLPL